MCSRRLEGNRETTTFIATFPKTTETEHESFEHKMACPLTNLKHI
jgi:hypothetical protein